MERKVFAKAGRILGLDERKGGLVVKQDLHGNFRVNVTLCFPLFLRSPRLNRAHSGIDGKISSPCTRKRTKLSLTVKSDDVKSGRTDPAHGRFWTVQGRMG